MSIFSNILDLVQNISLLVALAAVYQVLVARLKKNTIQLKILSGLLFGLAGVLGMLTPLYLMPGIIFDGRSLILSVAGLFAGPLAAAIATLICAAFRLGLGGAGVWTGLGVIFSSTAIGLGFHYYRKQSKRRLGLAELAGFGLLVHVVMLAWMLILPNGAGREVLRQVGWLILTLYPLATVLICLLFQDYETQMEDRAALRESELRFTTLIDKSNTGYVITGPNGKLLTVNEAFANMLDYTLSDLSQVHFAEITHPDDVTISREVVRSLLSGEKDSLTFEKRYLSKTGQVVWTLVNTVLQRDEKGEPQYFITQVQDMSQRKAVEEALHDSEERMRTIFTNAPISIMLSRNGKYIFANSYGARNLGYEDAHELVGVAVEQTIAPESLQQVQQRTAQIDRGHINPTMELTLVRKDCSRIINESTSVPIQLADGPAALILGVDITQRKQAEAALRESEATLRSMIDAVSESLFLMELDGTLVTVNKTTAERLGLTVAELVGHNAFDLLPEEAAERRRAFTAQAIATGQPVRFEDKHLSRRVDISIYPVLDEAGRVRRLVVYSHDRTEQKQAEDAVRANEALLKQIIEILPIGLWITDAGGNIIHKNPAGGKIWGVKDNEPQRGLLEYHARRLPSREELAPHEWAHARSLYEGEIVTGELLEIDSFDGQKKTILNYSAPVMNDLGQIIAAVFINLDITEQMKMEEARRESDERFSMAMRATSDGLYDANIVTGERYVSPNYFTMLGYEPNEFELSDEFWYELMHPDDRERIAQLNVDFIENRIATLEGEFRMRARNGDWVWIFGRAYAVVRDDHGRATRIVGTQMDITERKRAEEALRKSEERFRLAMEATSDGLFDVNLETGERYFNPAYYRMLGYEPGEFPVTDEAWYEMTHPDDREMQKRVNQEHIENKAIGFGSEFRLRARNGEWVWIMGRALAVTRDANGRATRIIGTQMDITERKRLEEQKEAALKALQMKVDELERFNHLTVDRELRMIELKKEINALLVELGRPEKYRIVT